ncbi:MAG: AmmeMemoRadiSam system radical SAM enzyme [Victivallales bacterium]|nr:AmmeMemoRadiSam system radical SAM enzyme [Victivallales bacterium]
MTPLFEQEGEAFRCQACAHRCLVREGRAGACWVRRIQDGRVVIPWEEVSSLALDPMEKKPLFHFHPGKSVLSFGTLGCNLHCPFCQNWTISQAGRDPRAERTGKPISAQDIVLIAQQQNARAIASTYNEPLVSLEWTAEIFRLAKEAGLATVAVSNGCATERAVECLAPVMDAANLDLKSGTEQGYRQLGGDLHAVQETIRELHRRGTWLELTTLIVPNYNDSDAELSSIAEFIASVSPDIPWHISSYFSTYRMPPIPARTPPERLETAWRIGRAAGLHFVFTGNLHNGAQREDTFCPDCGELLLRRDAFRILQNHLDHGTCPACHAKIPGVWG